MPLPVFSEMAKIDLCNSKLMLPKVPVHCSMGACLGV